jgi:hypothetical protein
LKKSGFVNETPFYIYLNLTLIVPAIICLIRLKKISIEFLIFFIFLFTGLVNEIINMINVSNKVNSISTLIYTAIEAQCLLYIFSKWRGFNSIFIRNLQFGLFLSWTIGYIIKINSSDITIKWISILNGIVLIIIAIPILNKRNTQDTLSHRLIVIPYIVFTVYFITLDLLMAFLFNKTTQPLFISLYSLITIINFLSYISYSLAILWAPKKEQYL